MTGERRKEGGGTNQRYFNTNDLRERRRERERKRRDERKKRERERKEEDGKQRPKQTEQQDYE